MNKNAPLITFIISLILLALAPVFITKAAAGEVTFEWSYPTEDQQNITGFELYHRVEGGTYNYTVKAATAGPTARTAKVSGLAEDGEFHYFVIRAVNSTYSQTSNNSNEVSIAFDGVTGEVIYPFDIPSPQIMQITGRVEGASSN